MQPKPKSDTLKKDEVARIASAAGLVAMDAAYLEQLAKSTEKGRFHINQLPRDLSWNEEPALMFRPDSTAGKDR
jgi:hypothetical protein